MVQRIVGRFLAAALVLALAPVASADWELNMPPGVTQITQEVYSLHMLIFWICVVIGIVVFGAMFYSLINHRASKHPTPATFSHSTKAEIIWTTIPIIILIAMAVPAARSLVAIEDAGKPDMTIKVTGYQWKWQYEYLEDGINFFSSLAAESNVARRINSGIDPFTVDNYLLDVDRRMVVPVDTKVRILLTANDVIHAWWVPELSGKRDAVPGFINQLWFKTDTPGVYRGQCAELCGRDHGFMPIVVEVKDQAGYDAWVIEQTGAAAAEDEMVAQAVAKTDWTKDELMARGEEVYSVNCVACHQANGAGLPPTFPAITGSAIATGAVGDHLALVLNGKAGTSMVAFGPQLNDVDLAAVLTYQRNALGNDVGDVITPAQVRDAR